MTDLEQIRENLACDVYHNREDWGDKSLWSAEVAIETLLALLIAQAAHLKELEDENKELLARVERGATTQGTGSTATSNRR